MTEAATSSAATSAEVYDIAAREADIMGRPQRIPPLPQAEAQGVGGELMAMIRAATGSPPPASPEIADFIATIARHPRLIRAHFGLATELFRTELEPRDRELAILRTGWLCKAPYEWGEHVKIGKRWKLTTEEIERITVGSSAPGWSDHDHAIVRAVEELFESAMISDETWAILARDLNDMQLIELPILVGQYQGVAYVQNSLRVRLGEGNPGLTAR